MDVGELVTPVAIQSETGVIPQLGQHGLRPPSHTQAPTKLLLSRTSSLCGPEPQLGKAWATETRAQSPSLPSDRDTDTQVAGELPLATQPPEPHPYGAMSPKG